MGSATRSGIGALLGFLCGVAVKLAACVAMAVVVFLSPGG
jgi:uncharacterized membrane protein (Fun14 family)